jgi:Carboxypeptidase regulatory-like domain
MKDKLIGRPELKSVFECLLLIVLVAGATFAQDNSSAVFSSQTFSPPYSPSTHSNHAILQGIVTKDPGSVPLKKALIELIADSQNDSRNYTALSGADGSFRIEDVVPGRYRLFAERSGYQEIDKHRHRSEGRLLTFSAGQEVSDLTIRLQAAAVVEGRVSDEDGDPMPEAQVAVLRQTFVAGHRHWEQVRAERTNDLGQYRIPGLAAGDYFVSVTPPPDFRSLIETTANTPEAAPRSGAASNKPAPVAYQTTYYPGARDRGQATSIQLRAGDEFPVNFSLTPSPSLSIRGSVANLPDGTTAAIMLQSKDLNLVLNGAEMHKDGSFEIRGVSPGDYTIVATVDNVKVPMMARQSLQLAESVEGLRLSPQRGGTIQGRLRMEANGTGRSGPAQILLLLCSSDGDDESVGVSMGIGFSTLTKVSGDGSFEWKDVPPGLYSVQVSATSEMPDWFLKSVTAGGRDVLDSGFSVNGGATTLDLVASANGAVAEGVASNQNNGPVADAVVVAVPELRLRGRPERYRKTVTDQSGRFTLRGLPSGDYTLIAWESVDGEAYYNSEFLKTYEGQGKALHLDQGRRVSVQLKTIPEVDDRP